MFPHCAGFQGLLVEKELADSRNNSTPPLETFALKKEVKLRFLLFQLLDFWGKGGGLQYFSVEYGERISEAEPPIKVKVFENRRNTSWTPTVPIWASTRATWRDANRSATKCLTVLPSIGETKPPHQVDHALLYKVYLNFIGAGYWASDMKMMIPNWPKEEDEMSCVLKGCKFPIPK